MVPINEMTKLYEDQDALLVRPEVGQWCRIKAGVYQDDLGVVVNNDEDSRIYVKLIPRVNFNTDKGNKRNFFERPE